MKDKWGGDDSVGDKAITKLHAFTDSLNLKDFYRVSNPSGWLFTWFNSQHCWLPFRSLLYPLCLATTRA